MLNIFKKLFLIGFTIFFVVATYMHIPYVYDLYKTRKLQDITIPKIKYILTDIDLLFPTNAYQQWRRVLIWLSEEYVLELNNLNSIEDGYVVSKADFENKDPNNPFYQWKDIHNYKYSFIKPFLLLFGDLSETQKQAILDFYEIYDKAYYDLAKELLLIENPKSMRELDYIYEKMMCPEKYVYAEYDVDLDEQAETAERQENEN